MSILNCELILEPSSVQFDLSFYISIINNVLFSGNSNIDEVNTIPQAILAHLDGIHIVAVPVGRAFVNFDEIEGLASRPKQQNIISIDSMQSLASIIANVTDSMCNGQFDVNINRNWELKGVYFISINLLKLENLYL